MSTDAAAAPSIQPKVISYSAVKRERALERLPFEPIQRALLAASVICGIISLIPAAGFYGSLALRSVAVIAAGTACVNGWKKEGIAGLALQLLRMAFVALGLAGAALHQPIFLITSLAGDAAFQTLEVCRGLQHKDFTKALSHFALMIIDAFVIAAFVSGMWQYLVAASAISAATMTAFAAKAGVQAYHKNDLTRIFEAVCYGALAALGIAGAVSSSLLTHRDATKYYFLYKNSSMDTIRVYDAHGNVVMVIPPGETASFALDPSQVAHHHVKFSFEHSPYGGYLTPTHTDVRTVIINDPIKPKDFSNLPVSGAAVITTNHSMREHPKAKTLHPDGEVTLKSLLEDSKHPVFGCFAVDDNREKFIFSCKGSKEKYSFDYESVCKQAGYILGLRESKMKESEERELLIDVDKKSFLLLMNYFQHGDFLDADQVEEMQLIHLYQTAEFLAIPRLIDQTMQEIAKRVDQGSWKRIDLFKPYKNSLQRLGQLVNLYRFS